MARSSNLKNDELIFSEISRQILEKVPDYKGPNLEEFFKESFRNMRLLISNSIQQQKLSLNQQIREQLLHRKDQMKSERQNFLKLLKHIKSAICTKKEKAEGLRELLDHLQMKIDELLALKFDKKSSAPAQPIIDVKDSYNKSSELFKREITMLRSQIAEQDSYIQQWRDLVQKFKAENEAMLTEVHQLRKSTSLAKSNCLKL